MSSLECKIALVFSRNQVFQSSHPPPFSSLLKLFSQEPSLFPLSNSSCSYNSRMTSSLKIPPFISFLLSLYLNQATHPPFPFPKTKTWHSLFHFSINTPFFPLNFAPKISSPCLKNQRLGGGARATLIAFIVAASVWGRGVHLFPEACAWSMRRAPLPAKHAWTWVWMGLKVVF